MFIQLMLLYYTLKMVNFMLNACQKNKKRKNELNIKIKSNKLKEK